ncbi:MAG: hypothetical protein ACE5H9_09205 [Anaerolineae bacterium]
MWASNPPIRLLRYLLVLRVNSSLVRTPACLPLELSLVLGMLIAERLPTSEARPWRKALAPWSGYKGEILELPGNGASVREQAKSPVVPDVSWPLATVLYAYPGKQMYGRGEPILWELKLLGESADHGLFLELVLPAIEEASSTTDSRWKRPHKLWGNFDIDAVYVARGLQWEPLVQDGRLNLRYQPTPTQWAEGETLTAPGRTLKQLTWRTPFAFTLPLETSHERRRPQQKKKERPKVPGLSQILTATEARLRGLAPGRGATKGEVGEIFAGAEPSWEEALEQAQALTRQQYKLKRPPKHWPGNWIGAQRFSAIPPAVVPYLNLAAITHVGHYTHFGCGTFTLSG